MYKFTKAYEQQQMFGELLKSQKAKTFNPQDKSDNLKRFELITSQMAAIYTRKNKDYGNSFDISLDEDGLLVSKIRLNDKMLRFGQLIKNSAEVEDESIRDTLIDMANYAIMTVMWMDAKEEMEAVRKMHVTYGIGGSDLDGDIYND